MRLTYKDKYGHWCSDGSKASLQLGNPRENWPSILWGDAVDKLAAYEDAEEQGRLVILPCKVGDALFITDEGTPLPAVRMVELVEWRNGKVFVRAVNSRTGIDYYCSVEDFGKTVFLTREEAKAALKGGRDNEWESEKQA